MGLLTDAVRRNDAKHTAVCIRRGNAATHIATDIHVEGNTVVAFGSHAAFNTAGMLLGGPVQDLTVADNDIRCEGCLGMDRGIWLGGGEFKNLEILDNNVDKAGQALLVGYDFATQIAVSNATILGNTLLNSADPSGGQISLIATGSTIAARIANNVIHDGSGYGILCQGAPFSLADLLTNDFAGNVQGDIFGCP